MIDIALTLIILHGIDGHEIRVAPAQITSLHSPRQGIGKGDKIYDPRANCLVGLTDSKNVQVTEACTTIQRMLENSR